MKSDAIEKDPTKYFELLNRLNKAATTVRVYDHEKKQIIIEAWYPEFYDKTEFARFLDVWNEDGSRLFFKDFPEIEEYMV